MQEYFTLIYHNSHLHLALFLLIFTPLYSVTFSYHTEDILFYTLTMVLLLVIFAIVQEAFFLTKRKYFIYKDLTKLLLVTKKIENELDILGATGKGLYEKMDSIQKYSDDRYLMTDTLKIAESRNKAMHDNPKIIEIDKILQNATSLLTKLKIQRYKKNILLKMIATFIVIYLVYIAYVYAYLGGALLTAYLASYALIYIIDRLKTVYSTTLVLLILLTLLAFKYKEFIGEWYAV